MTYPKLNSVHFQSSESAMKSFQIPIFYIFDNLQPDFHDFFETHSQAGEVQYFTGTADYRAKTYARLSAYSALRIGRRPLAVISLNIIFNMFGVLVLLLIFSMEGIIRRRSLSAWLLRGADLVWNFI